MSDEEIIKNINKTLEIINSRAFYEYVGDGSVYMTAITDLLDLYKKEKEKNKGLEIRANELNGLAEVVERDYIHKDKIKDFVSKKMKYLYVDSCAEDSGKYTAYKNILNLLEEGINGIRRS